jgi:hypothetical protein
MGIPKRANHVKPEIMWIVFSPLSEYHLYLIELEREFQVLPPLDLLVSMTSKGGEENNNITTPNDGTTSLTIRYKFHKSVKS